MLTQRLIQQVHLRDHNLDMDGDQQPNLSQGQRRREEETRREGGGGRGRRKGEEGRGEGWEEGSMNTNQQLAVNYITRWEKGGNSLSS